MRLQPGTNFQAVTHINTQDIKLDSNTTFAKTHKTVFAEVFENKAQLQ